MARKPASDVIEVSLFWFLAFCLGAPALIVNVYNIMEGPMSPEETQMAIFAGTVGTLVLNLFLVMIGKERIYIFRRPQKPSVPKVTPVPKPPAVPRKPAVPKQPKSIVITDPATKSQRLYNYDEESGEWVSDDGQSILDTSRLDEWYKQRMDDRAWQDRQNEKIRNRQTAFDRDIDALRQKMKDDEARMEEEQAIAQKNLRKYGEYTTDKNRVKEIIEERQAKEREHGKVYEKIGNRAAFLEKGAEWTLWIADLGIDICDIASFGTLHGIKNAYIVARNTAGDLSDAIVFKKDLKKTALKTITKTTVDLTQANVSKIGYKYAANGIGDGIKGAMQAAEEGKDPTAAFFKEGLKGTLKTGVEHGMKSLPKSSASTKILEQTRDKSLRVLQQQSSGQLSEKTANGLRNFIRSDGLSKAKAVDGQIKDYYSLGINSLISFL